MKNTEKTLKKEILRHNEYYDMQDVFDDLYKKSQENYNFKSLYKLITDERNILLAYRNIKTNKGSHTAGTNDHDIIFWENRNYKEYIQYVRNRLNNYQPQKIKRIEIPKPNGKKRPLGIPCIEDRLIQQCIKQILEPICEAKFHKYSYGFRPNRSTENAIAHFMKKVNIEKNYYIVNIDIKGFFDNVNHKKLIQQIWTLGIHDKKVISILQAMLKAEIQGIGIPSVGVPQGGILSPLLSNIVLNELDWWISSQWLTFKTTHEYSSNTHKYRSLKKSNLKEISIIRYADDFKIFCKSQDTANKIYYATIQWLKERLNLEINTDKSNIIDIRKSYVEFLGFRLKAVKKKKKYIIKSRMTVQAKKQVENTLRKQIKSLKHNNNGIDVYKLNKMIVGKQNYYRIATHITKDFGRINYNLSKCLEKRIKKLKTKTGYKTREYEERYKGYKNKEIYVNKTILYPIYAIKTKTPLLFTQNKCNYTKEGRELIHKELSDINQELLFYIRNFPNENKSVEFNDNKISKYIAQKGKCAVTGKVLDYTMEVHHIKPTSLGGTDKYKNLIIVTYEAHKLIHAVQEDTINKYLEIIKPNKEILDKVNKYRIKVENNKILSETGLLASRVR